MQMTYKLSNNVFGYEDDENPDYTLSYSNLMYQIDNLNGSYQICVTFGNGRLGI